MGEHTDATCPECHPPWVNEGWVPCGKVRTTPERIVWMCNLPDGHEGDCSPVRAGRLPGGE
jgi:hypothetical protein